MKKILIPFVLLLISCSTNKPKSDLGAPSFTIQNPCPNDGNCSFELIKNKSILPKTDGIGKPYYELVDNAEKSVYLYNYSNKVIDSTLQDAGYREEIIFEIENKLADFNYSGLEIQNTKMFFGVFCFCRGKAGYYPVSTGSVSKKNNAISIEIPSIVSNQKTVKLNIK